ncbi:MAG: mechanosensitive ion channel family protein, partial [Acidimicrobiia bacterium]|nr:mechanosensitive ion channel family protein [Acidimicrobiia bacterium]
DVESAVESAQVTGWQVLAAVIVLIAAWPVGRVAQRLVKRAFRKVPNAPSELIYDVSRGARGLIYLAAAAIALVLVGVGSSWVAIVIVVVLLVVVLTARPQIQNTSAGLVLTVRPSFGVGDQIQVLETRGTVLQVGSHSTVLESVDGIRSYIPNTSMLGEMVHVYTAGDARRAQFEMSLGAGTDIAKALGIIAKALPTADGVLADPASEVLATGLDQDAMIATARFWYPSKRKTDKVPVSAAILAVRNALDEAGIELGGATTGIDIVNEPASSDNTSPT